MDDYLTEDRCSDAVDYRASMEARKHAERVERSRRKNTGRPSRAKPLEARAGEYIPAARILPLISDVAYVCLSERQRRMVRDARRGVRDSFRYDAADAILTRIGRHLWEVDDSYRDEPDEAA